MSNSTEPPPRDIGAHTDVRSEQIRPAESPSEAAIRAVSTAAGREPVDDRGSEVSGETSETGAEGEDSTGGVLPPLYDTVAPDALDAFVTSGPNDPDGALRVRFRYAGFDVRVSSAGVVSLRDAPGSGRP